MATAAGAPEAVTVAARVGLRRQQVQAVLSLLDDGATVPFITRYRAANTGGLDEVQVRAVRDALVEQRELARAKLKALAVVDERAPPAARAQLHRAIQAAADRETLKDILAPFGGAGKKSLAEAARVDGLEPLALEVWAGRLNDAELRRLVGAACSRGPRRSSQEVLEGVSYLLAELVVTAASESGGGGGGGGGTERLAAIPMGRARLADRILAYDRLASCRGGRQAEEGRRQAEEEEDGGLRGWR
jgi:transcriptional accessory protein Tex/SPT6